MELRGLSRTFGSEGNVKKSSNNPPTVKVTPPWILSVLSLLVSFLIVFGTAIISGWSITEVVAFLFILAVFAEVALCLLLDRKCEFQNEYRCRSGGYVLRWRFRFMAWPGFLGVAIAGGCAGIEVVMAYSDISSQAAKGMVMLSGSLMIIVGIVIDSLPNWTIRVSENVIELRRPRGFYVIETKDIVDNGGRTVLGVAVPAWIFVDGAEGEYVIRGNVDLPLRGWKRQPGSFIIER